MLRFEQEVLREGFEKWHIRNLPYDAVLHRISVPDIDMAHDHPCSFTTQILAGGYIEKVWTIDGSSQDIHRKVGDRFRVEASTIHQIIYLPEGECLTFIRFERDVNRLSFYKFGDEMLHRYWDQEEWRVLNRTY